MKLNRISALLAPAVWLGVSVVGFGAGCGSSLSGPPLARHRPADFVEVPYPPPAALAETVPPRARREAVWIDGEWTYQGRIFVWQRGGWVIVPPGVSHAPWRVVYDRDGRLLLAPGIWYGARGRRIAPPEILVAARTPANEFTPEPPR